eukprot:SAG11_NODE_13636_length_645_cov_2.917582_1_plen_115_part_00
MLQARHGAPDQLDLREGHHVKPENFLNYGFVPAPEQAIRAHQRVLKLAVAQAKDEPDLAAEQELKIVGRIINKINLQREHGQLTAAQRHANVRYEDAERYFSAIDYDSEDNLAR